MPDFPQSTSYFCPTCGHPVIMDEVEEAHADPGDYHGVSYRTSRGFYCTNDPCDHSVEPIEDHELRDNPHVNSEEQ